MSAKIMRLDMELKRIKNFTRDRSINIADRIQVMEKELHNIKG